MSEIILRAEEYVKELLTTHLSPSHYYHDWSHTQAVLKEAKALGRAAQLSDDQMEILLMAGLFHDTGFTQSYTEHESQSKEIANSYLTSIQYPENKQLAVLEAIEATRVPHPHSDKIGALLQDADLSSLASTDWDIRADLLRKEQAELGKKTFTDEEWVKNNFEFYKQTLYHTPEGKSRYDAGKEHNQELLKKQNKKLNKKSEGSLINANRTAELLFKTALRNHISLTQIADNKANIMLSINALILTFAMPILFQKANFRENWYFVVPFSIIGLCCIISIVYAALATQPGKFKGKFVSNDLGVGKGSLFFFGNFFASSLEDYTAAMKKALAKEEDMDDSAILDLYFMGKSLGRKFHLLRLCYSFFLMGIIIGSLLFLVGYGISIV